MVLTADLLRWDLSGAGDVRPNTQVQLRVRPPRAVRYYIHFGPRSSSIRGDGAKAMLLAGHPGNFDFTLLMWVLLQSSHHDGGPAPKGIIYRRPHLQASAPGRKRAAARCPEGRQERPQRLDRAPGAVRDDVRRRSVASAARACH